MKKYEVRDTRNNELLTKKEEVAWGTKTVWEWSLEELKEYFNCTDKNVNNEFDLMKWLEGKIEGMGNSIPYWIEEV